MCKRFEYLIWCPLILLWIVPVSNMWSCTCDRLYYCEYLKNPDNQIAIEATVLHHKVYLQNDAVFLRVDKVFRDDVGITDVIKLYGKAETADCHVNVLDRFPDGAKVYLIIELQYNGNDVSHGFVNPDAIYEDHWEMAPLSCLLVVLEVHNNIVSGPILPELREFPLGEFEKYLQHCDFPEDVLNTNRCDQLPFRIYPNPSRDGIIHIGNHYRYTSIKRIRIFDLSGRNVYDETLDVYPLQKAIVTFTYSGMYILEFRCEENTFIEKLMVQLE